MDSDRFTYSDRKLNVISFPLGGIGTGCINLAGNGRLIDWEIFNHPNKGSVNGFSHFAIKAERDGRVLDARVLQGDLSPPYIGNLNEKHFSSFGFGPPREYLTGVPHFQNVIFKGQYPIAELMFDHSSFPGAVKLTAFNPFIPHNVKDSSIPAAFLTYEIANTTDESITYTLAGTLQNPLPAQNLNRYENTGSMHFIILKTDGAAELDLQYGELALGVLSSGDISYCEYWYRGRWFDNLQVYWDDFTKPGPLKNRRYLIPEAGEGNCSTLAPEVTLAPGEMDSFTFVIAWYIPNRANDWRSDVESSACQANVKNRWRNFYATIFGNAKDAAEYALTNWQDLYENTKKFQTALFSSSLPPVVLDAVSANLSVLKSPTVMLLEDGTFYGFEGCHPNAGCCEGSCTHVWNYAQALPFLYPELERSMREANYMYNQRPDGGMAFRLQLPLGIGPSSFRPCVDGQFGDVLKVYREWKICGDTAWLKSLWPAVKRSIAYAWSSQNEDRWDPEQTGVLHGRQHHTLDMELFAPNSWLTGFYLAALKAGAEMADYLGETETATEYQRIFEEGKLWVDTHLFNGKYYHQLIDLKDAAILQNFTQGSASMVGDVSSVYWDGEYGEIKYQIAEGCGIDQILAQWHANIYGLGEIFNPANVRTALESLYEYNFVPQMREYFNPCRVFAMDDEAGLIICSWPVGSQKPVIPVPYAQEVMTGFEYAAAIHMLQTGLIEQGMDVIHAVRNRYDGEKRNPWNEFECGSHYARSLASYALLNAFSGFSFDMVHKVIGFDPLELGEDIFQCFWSIDRGWGTVHITNNTTDLRVLSGALTFHTLNLPCLKKGRMSVSLDGKYLPKEVTQTGIFLEEEVTMYAGQILHISVE